MNPPTLASITRLQENARALRDEARSRFVEEAHHIPGRADSALRQFGEHIAEIDEMVEQARRAAAYATSYIRERPFRSLGIALAAGLVVGLLRRR